MIKEYGFSDVDEIFQSICVVQKPATLDLLRACIAGVAQLPQIMGLNSEFPGIKKMDLIPLGFSGVLAMHLMEKALHGMNSEVDYRWQIPISPGVFNKRLYLDSPKETWPLYFPKGMDRLVGLVDDFGLGLTDKISKVRYLLNARRDYCPESSKVRYILFGVQSGEKYLGRNLAPDYFFGHVLGGGEFYGNFAKMKKFAKMFSIAMKFKDDPSYARWCSHTLEQLEDFLQLV